MTLKGAVAMRKPLQFSGSVIASGDELAALLKRLGAPRVVVADLSLGTWTPQALATQILGGLIGKEVSPKAHGTQSMGGSDRGGAICASIDHEGRGNSVLLTAHRNARQIGAVWQQRPAPIVIVAPAFGIAWRRDDQLLIEYLASVSPELELHFVVLKGQTPAWPAGWSVALTDSSDGVPDDGHPKCLLARLPGVVGPIAYAVCTQEERKALIELGNGWAVVRPELRRAPTMPGFTSAELAALVARGWRHIIGYILYYSPRAPESGWALCQEAWKQFDGGYHELSMLFIEAAQECVADPETKALFASHRQAMLLAAADYAGAAAAEEPDAELPTSVRGLLLQAKGWGLVMSNRPTEALPRLHQALSLLQPEVPDIPFMFLLNITALAEQRCGNHEAAKALEKRIERLIVEYDLQDARLQYVNWINLARLGRYVKDLDAAEHYYSLAFSTVEGAPTECDSIHANLCRERIEHARGNHRAALDCLVRAAMYWCASDCPESLNWRVQTVIFGKPRWVELTGTGAIVELVEALAAALLVKLQEAGEACGVDIIPNGAGASPFFFYDGTMNLPKGTRYGGEDGWAVMVAETELRKQPYGPNYDSLLVWLDGWMRRAGVAGAQCYLIDRSNGEEMPVSWPQMLASAIRCDVREFVFNGERVSMSAESMQPIADQRVLFLNPIVASTEKKGGYTLIKYKRYFQPYQLNEDEQILFSALGRDIAQVKKQLHDSGFDGERVERTIRRLQQRHIVQVKFRSLPACPTVAEPQASVEVI
jgi:tetratricopeptide (TPR) repeat protein